MQETNEKISTSDLPISFGTLERSFISQFRVPRSVYPDADNYPDAPASSIINYEDTMVVEHTIFQGTTEFNQLNEENDFILSDREGGINKDGIMYQNFKGYIERNSNDSVNIEVDAYLTNEEILSIRSGEKLTLFGVNYKPLNMSNIEFEKDGSVVTILMTKESDTDSNLNLLTEQSIAILTEQSENLTTE